MALRNKDMLEIRRKNNIFGERDDRLVIKFLNLGGTGVLYNTNPSDTFISFFGRGDNQSYIVHAIYKDSPDDVKELQSQARDKLQQIADLLHHIPLYVIIHNYSKKVQFFHLNGEKVLTIK